MIGHGQSFDWTQLNDIIDAAFRRAMVDESYRWFGIGHAPNAGRALQLAHALVPRYCARAFVGRAGDGRIAVWIDVLSWQLEGTDA